MQQIVERILNRPLVIHDGATLIVRARVEAPRRDRSWRVDLETDNGQRRATRSLEAASCDELANATALFLAVLIEPNVEQPNDVEQSNEMNQPGTARSTAPAEATSNVARRKSFVTNSAEPRWAIGGVTGAITGVLPAWSPGFGVYGGFAWRALRSTWGATFWLPVEQTVDAEASQGAEFQLYSAHTELCLQHALQRFVPAVCSGAQFSILRGRGFGSGVEAETQHANFASVSAGGAFLFRYSTRLAFLIDFDALFPLGDRQFVFHGNDPALIHSPKLGTRLTFGAEFAL